MSRIIAGHFQLQDQIQHARKALLAAGFADERISAFYVNQPGQHDAYPIGGDQADSPGAKETPPGVATGLTGGALAGAAIGAATAVVTGPAGPAIGALVGAHVGSLYSFNNMKPAGAPESGGQNEVAPRQAGMLIAVALSDEAEQQRALDVLRQLGADGIEQAQGTIQDGDWRDFDPLAPPRPV